MNLKIYKLTLSKLEELSSILASDFDDFWSYSILKDEINSENSYYIVAKLENEIVGFAGIKVLLDEADIMNIVTKKSYRNKGIGSILLQNLIDLSYNLNLKQITLEVNASNLSAISLYKKFDFEKIGLRKNYYNNQNAIIMSKLLRNT